jgi:hypothetical protein
MMIHPEVYGEKHSCYAQGFTGDKLGGCASPTHRGPNYGASNVSKTQTYAKGGVVGRDCSVDGTWNTPKYNMRSGEKYDYAIFVA